MNKLERELKLLFGESELFSEAVFCGKTMIGKLDKDVRAKIEFISTSVHKHYDSLKVTVLNRTEGVIDSTVFNFSDMIGLKNGRIPYYWEAV